MSFATTNMPTCSHRLVGLPALSGDMDGSLIAVANSPPCTAKHEIPPVVSPVINAIQSIDISIECVYYIPTGGINVKKEILCQKVYRGTNLLNTLSSTA